MSRSSIALGVLLGCTLLGGVANAQTFTAFDLASPVQGNQAYGATIGLIFTVNSPINVTSLGAFDAALPTGAAHTLAGTLTTTIYNQTTQAAVSGLSASFSAADPGTLLGGYLYKSVGGLNGVTLAPGTYVIAWTATNVQDLEGNSTVPGYTPPTYSNGGGLITINQTQFRYNEQTAGNVGVDRFPTNVTGGQLTAGTFKFSAVTPEPGAVSLFAGMAVMGGSLVLRRRRVRKSA